MSNNQPDPLRAAAEAEIARAPDAMLMSPDAEKLLHELQVHQIELKMQNEELRRAQAIIEESRDRYADLYDFAPVAYLTLNREGMIDEINLTGAALLGVERKKLPYHRFASFVAPEDRDNWHRHFRDALTHDGILTFELSLQHDNLPRIDARLDCQCLKKNGGESAVRIALTDITGQKQAARAAAEAMVIVENEQKFRKITESAQDAIVMMGADKCISLWNPAAERIFGYTAGEALGREMHQLLAHPQAQTAFEHGFKDFLQTGTGQVVGKTLELVALRKGGVAFPVEVTISALQINGLWNAIGIFRDITERKIAEQKLRDLLAEKEVMMREIHHRVKNNLQMMCAMLELQAGCMENEQVQRFVRDSQQRVMSMAMIHEQLYHNDNIARIDFAAYLHSLADNLRGQFGRRSSQVSIRIDAAACTLPVDIAIPCGLAVSELASNVFKHAYPNGRAGELRITLQYNDDGKIILAVADDGVGLPAGFDIHRGNSFGMRLITLMVENQLHGKLSVESGVHQINGKTCDSPQPYPNPGTRIVCEIAVPK